jgi:protein TonB
MAKRRGQTPTPPSTPVVLTPAPATPPIGKRSLRRGLAVLAFGGLLGCGSSEPAPDAIPTVPDRDLVAPQIPPQPPQPQPQPGPDMGLDASLPDGPQPPPPQPPPPQPDMSLDASDLAGDLASDLAGDPIAPQPPPEDMTGTDPVPPQPPPQPPQNGPGASAAEPLPAGVSPARAARLAALLGPPRG